MQDPGRLEITTKIGCQCRCDYCPQQLLISQYFKKNDANPDTLMSLDTFKKCINKLPKGTRIDFSGMAEPWLNPKCTEMVLYAHEKGFPIAVYSTFVGMTYADFEMLKEIPYEEFVLHIPDDKSRSHINVTSDYIKLLEDALEYKQQSGKGLVTGISCHAGVHPAIKKAVPEDSKLITEIHNRAGNLENEFLESKINHGEIVCVNCGTDMHHNVLLPDGTVLLCCMDYGMKHILGNLLYDEYDEIYKSEESQKVRYGLKNDKNDILCRNCVNARNVSEIFDEYIFYKKWVTDLEKQKSQRINEINEYKKWVDKLEKRNQESKNEIQKINEQYNQRVSENKEYKTWVSKLEKQNQELRDEVQRINTAYEQRVKELHEYMDWVNKLQN